MVPEEGFHYMDQVVLDLSLSYPQHLRQLKRRESRAGQQLDDALALSAIERQHGVIVGERVMKSQASGPSSLKVVFVS
jgi:hypothetical protein